MKTSTIAKRLEKRYTGSKARVAYKVVSDMVNGTNRSGMVYDGFNTILRPTTSTKRGVVCYKQDIVDLLTLLGIKHFVGNDGVRGGQASNFIKITHKID